MPAGGNNKKKGGYLMQGTILAVSSLLVRFIGMLYRIPMTRIVGDEGMGIYNSAYELYNLALILSSYSVPLAVSKLVSARESVKKYSSTKRVFFVALVTAMCTGLLASCVLYFGADVWADIAKMNIAMPLKVLAPTIFVFAIMGVIRGLFQGKGTMFPTAFSQVIEQIINAIVSVAAAYYLMLEHNASEDIAAYGATGGTLGTFLGAVAGCTFLLMALKANWIVIRSRARRDENETESYSEVFKAFVLTVVPIILSQTVYQLSGTIDFLIYGNVSESMGIAGSISDAYYGVYSNKYRQLTNLPVAIATALGTAIVPSLSKSFAAGEHKEIKNKISGAVKLNMLISIPAAVGLAVLAEPVIIILYTGRENFELSVNLLRLGSIAVVLFAFSTLTNGVLQGINRMRLPVYHAAVSLAIHVVLLFVMLKVLKLDAYGLVIGNVTFAFVVCLLNLSAIKRYAGYHQELLKTFIIPGISALIMGGSAYYVYEVMYKLAGSFGMTGSPGTVFAFVIAFIIAVIVYFAMLLILHGLDERDVKALPMGGRIYRVLKRMHLMK